MKFFTKSIGLEEQNEVLATEEMGKALELYEIVIDFYSELIEKLMDLSHRKIMEREKIAILFIVNKLRITSQAIRLLLLRGYYYEAKILERSFYEGIGLSLHFYKNKKDAQRWLKYKKLNVKTRKLFEQIPEILSHGRLKFNFGDFYKILCDHVHGNFPTFDSFLDLTKIKTGTINGEEVRTVNIREIQFDLDENTLSKIISYPMILLLVILTVYDDELDIKSDRTIVVKFYDLAKEYTSYTDNIYSKTKCGKRISWSELLP